MKDFNTILAIAESGDPEAQAEVGFRYFWGVTIENVDYEEAVKWFKMSADQGCAYGQYWMQRCINENKGIDSDPSLAKQYADKAFQWFSTEADKNDPKVQLYLGYCYQEGAGVDPDAEEAFHWYLKSAEQDCADAAYCVSICYAKGFGVATDDTSQKKWTKRAAELGNPPSQYNLGAMYLRGDMTGVPCIEMALKWYSKAAEQGHPIAQYEMGVMYAQGEGVTQSDEEAARWWQKAAKRGFIDAIFNLGCFYELEKNTSKAFELWQQAAAQGDDSSKMKLAQCYEAGDGVEKSEDQAIALYMDLAEKGYLEGAEALLKMDNNHLYGKEYVADLLLKYGMKHRQSNGTTHSNETAAKWFKKALYIYKSLPNSPTALLHLAKFYRDGYGVDPSAEEAKNYYKKAASKGSEEAAKKLKEMEDGLKICIIAGLASAAIAAIVAIIIGLFWQIGFILLLLASCIVGFGVRIFGNKGDGTPMIIGGACSALTCLIIILVMNAIYGSSVVDSSWWLSALLAIGIGAYQAKHNEFIDNK